MIEEQPFVESVSVRNFKSIGDIRVALRPVTVIVGPNGSGKSNFLDSLRFVADALVIGLAQAIAVRGGAKAISHKRKGPFLRIEITLRLSENRKATYLLELDRGLVRHESLSIVTPQGLDLSGFLRTGSHVGGYTKGEPMAALPQVLHDRLALATLSGLSEFREAFDALIRMRFYHFNPEAMRQPQDLDDGTVLREDGSNITSVWRRLKSTHPSVLDRVTQFLGAIVPGVTRIRVAQIGPREIRPKETLRFHQAAEGQRELHFYASSMSDGTLRALGALVASQQGSGSSAAPTVVGIEEPETALHPGAVAALMDALHEASSKTQVIITSHSPDLLDHVDIDTDALLVTDLRDGATTIAAVDGASREAIRRDLYTPGELLRMDQLQPVEATRG